MIEVDVQSDAFRAGLPTHEAAVEIYQAAYSQAMDEVAAERGLLGVTVRFVGLYGEGPGEHFDDTDEAEPEVLRGLWQAAHDRCGWAGLVEGGS